MNKNSLNGFAQETRPEFVIEPNLMIGKKMIRSKKDKLNRRCAGHWPQIFMSLAPELAPVIKRGTRHGPCPWHYGKDGFRCFNDFEETGGSICNSCGAFPNGFLLLARHKSWSMSRVRREIKKVLPLIRQQYSSSHNVISTKCEDIKVDQKKLSAIEDVLSGCIGLNCGEAEPAKNYIENRGVPFCAYYPSLLFHSALPYFDNGVKVGEYPALIAKIEDEIGTVSLLRTYITANGQKAPVPSPKKLMPVPYAGRMSGAAIRLFSPPYAELAVAEGIETALAVMHATGTPVWATVSANGMESLRVPADVKRILVFADKDRSGTGQRAARILEMRLSAEGHGVEVIIPHQPIPDGVKGIDWLDVLTGKF